MSRLPIRTRLTIVSAGLMTVLIAVLGAFLYLRLRTELLQTVDDGLRSRAEVLSGGETFVEGGGLADPGDAFAQVMTLDGRVLHSSEGLPPAALLSSTEVAAVDRPTFFTTTVRTIEESVPGRLLAVPSNGRVLVVGSSLDDQHEALARLLALLLVGGPVAVALASLAGWVVAGTALRPVERLRVEAEAVSASEPGRRLPVAPNRDELADLGESLNRMLERLERSASRERRFVADASHELRTPLANMKAELELALRRARSTDELSAALMSAAEEVDRLIGLAEDLLVLARADGGRMPVHRTDVDLEALVRETLRTFAVRAAEQGVALEPQVDAAGRAQLDDARIRQAVENLLDNALRHTPRGGLVRVTLTRRNGSVSIAVTDTGEGFDVSFLPRAFEPFSRVDGGRRRDAGGAGLGLAIVEAVAQGHGGSVEAANEPGGGARVAMVLPA